MKEQEEKPYFQAHYRNPGPLPRRHCDHALFPLPEGRSYEDGCQFAKIDTFLFGLTKKGLELFKCFLDSPELLASEHGWNPESVKEIVDEGWAGTRLSFAEAMERMKSLADIVQNYDDGSILFVFSKDKVDFNVEVYSTPALDFIEGFIITAVESEKYTEYFSLAIFEGNIIEIECDYGLNEPPDDNPWGVRYDGDKLSFGEYEILPE